MQQCKLAACKLYASWEVMSAHIIHAVSSVCLHASWEVMSAAIIHAVSGHTYRLRGRVLKGVGHLDHV